MQCTNCSQELVPGAEFCGNCGAKLLNVAPATPQPVAQTAPPQPPVTTAEPVAAVQPDVPTPAPAQAVSAPPQTSAVPGAYAIAKQPKNGFSIASLVLGICALVTFFFVITAIVLGILAIIFGFLGLKRGSKGMAISGIILGIIGLLIGMLLVFGIFAISNHCKENPTAVECKDTTTTQQFIPSFLRD